QSYHDRCDKHLCPLLTRSSSTLLGTSTSGTPAREFEIQIWVAVPTAQGQKGCNHYSNYSRSSSDNVGYVELRKGAIGHVAHRKDAVGYVALLKDAVG
ncbi:hypothetical protein LTR37_014918, partial [Vermiconidia calcicola]